MKLTSSCSFSPFTNKITNKSIKYIRENWPKP
jgi:hypothetical protein